MSITGVAYFVNPMFNQTFWQTGKEWLVNHQKNLLLLAGVLLVGILAFESGFLKGKLVQSEPLVISIPAVVEPEAAAKTGGSSAGMERIVSSTKQNTASCPLVGSKNSNKYHLLTCAVAKRIKPENKVCFASKEDAGKRGYVAGCLK